MPLSDYNGQDSFSLNNKSYTNRGTGVPIYDITGGGTSLTSSLTMATHDYRVYGIYDLNNKYSLTIPNFTSSSKLLIIHDDTPGGTYGDTGEIMRQTLLGPGESISLTMGVGSTLGSADLTLSEDGVFSGTWDVGPGLNGTFRTISVCHFYEETQSGSGGVSGSSSGVLAQGRVRDMTNSSTYTAEQTGFSGPPTFSSSGATGYNSSRYYFTWTFPGINEADHIIKVTNAGVGTGTAFSRFMGYTLGSDTITVIWNMSSDTNFAWQELEHYISVERAPF